MLTRLSVVTKSNKEDTKKTAGGFTEKPKQGLKNKMDEQENAIDKKDETVTVEDEKKDKETELNGSTDSADSVVKVNGVVANVDVVTKGTGPESVTDKKVEEAQEIPENITVNTDNKDKSTCRATIKP